MANNVIDEGHNFIRGYSKQEQGAAVANYVTNYQFSNLNTTAKTIIGAINEIKGGQTT